MARHLTAVLMKGHLLMTAWASTSPLADQLFAQWNTTHAHSPHDFGTLGVLTGDEAVHLIRQPQEAADRDRTLLALLTLEHDGDLVAGSVLLKSFMPLALRLPSHVSAMSELWRHSPADARTAAIGVLWEVLKTYPLERSHSVAGNIRLNTIHELGRWYGTGPRSVSDVTVDDEMLENLAGAATVEDVFRDLITVLTWAVDTDVLKRDEVRLLARVELAEGSPGQARDDAAAELGISRETLNRRICRIRTKLINAVSDDVDPKLTYSPRRR